MVNRIKTNKKNVKNYLFAFFSALSSSSSRQMHIVVENGKKPSTFQHAQSDDMGS